MYSHYHHPSPELFSFSANETLHPWNNNSAPAPPLTLSPFAPGWLISGCPSLSPHVLQDHPPTAVPWPRRGPGQPALLLAGDTSPSGLPSWGPEKDSGCFLDRSPGSHCPSSGAGPGNEIYLSSRRLACVFHASQADTFAFSHRLLLCFAASITTPGSEFFLLFSISFPSCPFGLAPSVPKPYNLCLS